MTPRIAIIGTGAMGSVYAAHMAEAGYTVHAVDPWAAHVEAINSLGLRIEGPKGDRVVRNIRAACSASSRSAGIPRSDSMRGAAASISAESLRARVTGSSVSGT